MSDNDSGSNIISFLLGGIIGAGLGLFLAPCSGEETRRRLSSWLEEEREKTKDFIRREREAIHSKKEQVSAAWEAGKKAYRETSENDKA